MKTRRFFITRAIQGVTLAGISPVFSALSFPNKDYKNRHVVSEETMPVSLPDSPVQNFTINLWEKEIPGAVNGRNYWPKPVEDGNCLEKISNPELVVFLPPKENATGTAVLVIPGGGYQKVCVFHEGYDVAKWLAEQGIAGIVLKYRLPSDKIMKNKAIGPLQDAQEAMRVIRRNVAKWNISTNKIGVVGFSAGGHLASTLATRYNEKVYEHDQNLSARPDFSVLIYPVISFDKTITHAGSRTSLIGDQPNEEMVKRYSSELQVTAKTPPTFIVHAADDMTVPVMNSLRYFEALKKQDVPAEMHIYQRGGHGFGLGESEGTKSSWPQTSLLWIKTGGWL